MKHLAKRKAKGKKSFYSLVLRSRLMTKGMKHLAKRKKVRNDKCFIKDLPEEIVAYILSKNPIETIIDCNCVCKRWHSILSEPYFANLHLSRSPAGLIIYLPNGFEEFNIYNLADEDDKPHQDIQDGPVISFDIDQNSQKDFSYGEWPLCGSVNGLICLKQNAGGCCICNPITREYILLPDHKYMIKKSLFCPTYGFGFVKASYEYKVVCFYERGDFPSTEGSDKPWCEVYTLGTGMWRSLGQVPFLLDAVGNRTSLYNSGITRWYVRHDGVFVSGNLHWLVDDLDNNQERVCTFDLKNEVYQLTAPPNQGSEKVDYRRLGMLGECLCVCDNLVSGLTIWVMKDYGMKECWSKEIVIQERCPPGHSLLYGMVHPLKVFKDGSLILLSLRDYQVIYDTENETLKTFYMGFRSDFYNKPVAMAFVPSFISLKSFSLEKVSVKKFSLLLNR